MAMAGGWTLETHWRVFLATSYKRRSVVTLTTHGLSHGGQLTSSHVDVGSVDVRLQHFCGGGNLDHPGVCASGESPAALNKKGGRVCARRVKTTGKLGRALFVTGKCMHACVGRVCMG